jgi:hypothetical protein
MSDEQMEEAGALARYLLNREYGFCLVNDTKERDIRAMFPVMLAEIVRLRTEAANREALMASYQRVLALPRV